MSHTASVRTLRNDYASLIARAEAGETITILRHGKAVARLTPLLPANETVDWSKSDAIRAKSGRKLAAKALKAVLDDNKGDY
ncbi:MAG: type II toxin-antitoxin system prevent-host-death family antitoxin [Stagnimonas sp.]|nr:type II toxin-antitoxin system prevent-host-death family antitoxin [Stagnimonas sp.]